MALGCLAEPTEGRRLHPDSPLAVSVSSCLSAQALLAISLLHPHTPHLGRRHTPVLIPQCSVSQRSLG